MHDAFFFFLQNRFTRVVVERILVPVLLYWNTNPFIGQESKQLVINKICFSGDLLTVHHNTNQNR